ncbi:MAG TPA: hypothetical protein EYP10_05890 [Armatimonadetes bacterium]|nr:hypothetical protein [Armatimonadota bacterium]
MLIKQRYAVCIGIIIIAFAYTSWQDTGTAQEGGKVEFIFPTQGATVHEKFTIKLRKPDMESGYVALWLDGKFLTAIAPPFEYEIDPEAMKLKDGKHTIRAEARDGDGTYVGSAQVTFTLVRQAQFPVPKEGILFEYNYEPGQVYFYTVRAGSKAKGHIPKRAKTENLPFLEHRVLIHWNQLVRGITPDRFYQLSREIEGGTKWELRQTLWIKFHLHL